MINKIKKRFFPGDEWLYYKIYCGYKISDTILLEIIKPFTEQLIKENYIKKWFFIRYNDPNYHIRFRLELTDTRNIGYIINKFSGLIQGYIESKSIWMLQIDCYDREAERYGLSTMELSEDIFFNDSLEIADYLSRHRNEETENNLISKSIFSLTLIDFYLSNFKLSDTQKLKIMEKSRDSFYKEFDINKDNKKQIERIYLTQKETIYKELLDSSNAISSIALKRNIEEILKVIDQNSISENKVLYLISSLIHMSLNRLYYSNNRIHELVCYDLMWKFYKSKISRNQIQA